MDFPGEGSRQAGSLGNVPLENMAQLAQVLSQIGFCLASVVLFIRLSSCCSTKVNSRRFFDVN